jgi:hypothetical protein
MAKRKVARQRVQQLELEGILEPATQPRTCPTCGSKGFDVSVLGPDRCSFCDGTEGGNPPVINGA